MSYYLRILGLGLFLAGIRLFIAAPPGVNQASLLAFSLPLAGVLTFLFSGWGDGKKQALKALSGVFYFLLGIGALFTVIFALLDGLGPGYLVVGAAAGVGAVIGIGRSVSGNSRGDSLRLAPELGFAPIEEDSDFDAQGVVNGVRAAYSILEFNSRRRGPGYYLNVGCAAQNRAGVRFCAYAGGPGARPVKPLPEKLAEPPEYWEEFTVHFSPPGAQLEKFSGLRSRADSPFGDAAGLISLELEGELFKAGFHCDGAVNAARVKAALDGMTRAAALFG